MATSEQLDRAWADGYCAGAGVTKISRPRVPPRPAPIFPDVSDPMRYLFDVAFKAAVQDAAALGQP